MELFKLFGTIMVDNDKANKSIHQTETKAESAFSKIGKGVQTLAKVGLAGATAFATGIGLLTKSAVDNYAEYEQLVGGIDTLFKESNKIVMEYAENAYKTAGMSANQYMETVTSFSASLLQSLNGDTAESARIADMAITDMSDNANKMGTSMELIQNAYQGFAKNNYTMLDNLKLGYGGTQEEMQRLLDDAEKLTGVKYDMKNLNDVFEAIHAIQGELGITGTTAKEASTTIQGSIASMKSAWENLLTGMADPSQDLGVLIGNVVDTGVTVLNNLIPRIAETIPRIITGLGTVVQTIGAQLPSIINQLLPVVVSSGQQIIKGLFDAIKSAFDNLDEISAKIAEFLGMMGTYFQENLPTFLENAVVMLQGFVDKIAENLPVILQGGISLIMGLVQGLMDALPMLLEKVPVLISSIANLINDNMPLILQKGIEIVLMIGQGLINAIPSLIANIPQIIKAVVDTFFAFQWINIGKNIINFIKNGVSNASNGLVQTAKNTMESAKNALLHPIETAKTLISNIINTIKNMFNFKVSWPKIPMPHFNIWPSGWGIGDLLRGVIPSLGIDWYAKGGIMNDPTAFGVNPNNGKVMVGGEAGAEAIAPIDTLLDYVRTAVNESNAGLAEALQNIILLLSDYMPQLANMQLVLDSGALVGSLAPSMDEELGNIQRRKGR